MTKLEKSKCEALLDEAIRKANNSKEDYAAYERLLKEGKQIDAECRLRVADQEIGYADGINQVLATLGFQHEKMKELSDLL